MEKKKVGGWGPPPSPFVRFWAGVRPGFDEGDYRSRTPIEQVLPLAPEGKLPKGIEYRFSQRVICPEENPARIPGDSGR